jgi:hypothetical protein
MLYCAVSGRLFFLLGPDGVCIGCRQRLRHVDAFASGLVYQAADDVIGSRGAADFLDGFERFEPFTCFKRIYVRVDGHLVSCVGELFRTRRCG